MVDLFHVNFLASLLMNDNVLCTNDTCYRITEMELFLYNEVHDDDNCHKNKHQLEYNKLYFHKDKKGKFKTGRKKAIEITYGGDDSYSSFLIRGLYDIDNKKLITGTYQCAEEILGRYGYKEAEPFIKELGGEMPDLEDEYFIHMEPYECILKPGETLFREIVHSGPRLDLTGKDPKWRNIKYRYVSMVNDPRVRNRHELKPIPYISPSVNNLMHKIKHIEIPGKGTLADIFNGENLNINVNYVKKDGQGKTPTLL